MNPKANRLIDKIETDLVNKIRKKRNRREPFVLDDDFVPYIVPKICITSEYGRNGNISFREGYDTFLQVI